MAWDPSRWKLDLRTGLTVTTCALGIYGAYRLLQNRATLRDNFRKFLRAVKFHCPEGSKQNRLIVHAVRLSGMGAVCIAIYIVSKHFPISFTTLTKPPVVIGAFSLVLFLWIYTLKGSGERKPPEVDGLCVIAADQHTLTTIAKQVGLATGGFYSVKEHLVTNRKAVAELPIYTRAICCVRNAERNISFDREGDPEPDADLGFRAFHRMEKFTREKSGVLLLMFDHAESQDISELYSMAGITPSPRLRDTAEDGRFLTVYRQLNGKQIEFVKKFRKDPRNCSVLEDK